MVRAMLIGAINQGRLFEDCESKVGGSGRATSPHSIISAGVGLGEGFSDSSLVSRVSSEPSITNDVITTPVLAAWNVGS